METYPARFTKSSAQRVESQRGMPLRVTPEESAKFLRIVSQATLINRHYAIYQWLSGEVQQVLPHRILIAAWGDFAKRDFTVDVTSALPGVRTAAAARCGIDDFVRKAHAEWLEAQREPVLLETTFAPPRVCGCPIHAALRDMRSAVVHGICDQRNGSESLYIALDTEHPGAVARADGFRFLVDCLIAQIDVAFRRLAVFPPEPPAAPRAQNCRGSALSPREREILDWLSRGDSNMDIAAALDISPHTVKNHLQRIFRKIGVNNRTQAVAQYSEALRASGQHP